MRILRIKDILRLRVPYTKDVGIHLERYDLANANSAATVLDVTCPLCRAKEAIVCAPQTGQNIPLLVF